MPSPTGPTSLLGTYIHPQTPRFVPFSDKTDVAPVVSPVPEQYLVVQLSLTCYEQHQHLMTWADSHCLPLPAFPVYMAVTQRMLGASSLNWKESWELDYVRSRTVPLLGLTCLWKYCR